MYEFYLCVNRENFSFFKSSNLINNPDRLDMTTFLLWIILLILCWPLAIAALLLYPLIWLILLPFRLIGIAVDGVFELIIALFKLPSKIIKGSSPTR